MINLNTQNYYTHPYPIAFCGNFVIKKANLINRVKLDYLAGKSIITDPKNTVSKISFLDVFANIILSVFNSKIDIYCLLNQKKKL